MLNSIKTYLGYLIPNYISIRTDAEKFGITRFIKLVATKVKPGSKILDAGAGSCPYRKFFSHTEYESTDFSPKYKHTFICSLDQVPKPDCFYDAVISTQVLEHVENPQKVVNEFYRILKPKGKLFLTAPQGWGIHGAPYHYFNFTNYGLESLFKKAGFKIIFIKPRGGIFWYLGKRIKTLPDYIFSQYSFEKVQLKNIKSLKSTLLTIILFPFYLISLPICCFLIPLLFFYLDGLDKKQSYTLGYACYCVKKVKKFDQ